MTGPAGPLLVFGPRSTTYDFGPGHPLTPRRFGPGIDLLRAVGAEPGLAPQPVPVDALLACHTLEYVRAVQRLGLDPDGDPAFGIGPGDTPAFAGMHEASAAVVGGSLEAMEAILRGDVEHAHHPGGGLHHAMPARGSGFCVYDDPALAIARARSRGLRVLYVDLDVHHGDGVQAIHAADPGVLTFSIHESGRHLFPGTGFVGELGRGAAAGTSVNVPLEPPSGEGVWLAAVRKLVPELAAAFGPDVVVSQHGADAHAFDPLAHLRVTTTAMAEAARIVDAVAHRWASGRWLATGGGGYDAYRVVPRAWALTWLAGAHREPPDRIPPVWRNRWSAEAARYGQAPLPERFEDPPNAGLELTSLQADAERRSEATADLVRRLVVPRFLREAADRGWWDPLESAGPGAGSRWGAGATDLLDASPTIAGALSAAALDGLTLAARVIPPFDATLGQAIVAAALRAGVARASAAVAGDRIVGLVVSVLAPDEAPGHEIVALGIAPAARRQGLAGRLLAAHAASLPSGATLAAGVSVAERDPVDPLPVEERRAAADTLFDRAGFRPVSPAPDVRAADPTAVAWVRTI
jgi:acetoin utilization protein AcuC